MKVLESRTFGRHLGHEGGTPVNGISALIKEASESPLAPSGKGTQRQRQQWTRKVVSQEGDDTDTLVVDIQPSELCAMDTYCFSHPRCGILLHSPGGLDNDFSSTDTLFKIKALLYKKS